MILYAHTKEGGKLHIVLNKQPEKYLDKCTQSSYDKLIKAIDGLINLQGDIVKLQGRKDEYRLKIPPYRVIFKYSKTTKTITVTKIDTRGDVYKRG